jgi:acetate---CoA ligase (ADP-forming)
VGEYPNIAFPVVAKLDSVDLPHKTEAGAVRVGVQSAQALKAAVDDMVQSAKAYKPDARIAGVSIQQMATGIEVIVGTVNDPYFGPTVLFGLGGIFTELLKDTSMRFAPVSIEEARIMVTEIKASKLLTGYRGRLPVDLDQVAEIIHRVSWLAYDYQDRIAEIDINPIFARPRGQESLAADGLIVLKPMEKAL